MTAWLHVIGVGEAGLAALPGSTRLILSYAESVLGPPRFLSQIERAIETAVHPELTTADIVDKRGLEAVARALLEDSGDDEAGPPGVGRADSDLPTLIEWEGGLERMMSQVRRLRDTPTVILATGDPMWFGIGATLARHLEASEFEIHPSPSAFQLAAAAMRWPLQNVVALSLHGRPVELVQPHILPGNRILALTTDADTALRVADIFSARGYPESVMTILENLGGPEARTTTTTVADFEPQNIGDFYVLALDCIAGDDARLLPALPGLPDDAFVSDGQLTKREIRAATIAKLVPLPGALLWDVGAGCGSVGIEWMRAARDAEAVALERDEPRLEMIAANAHALGTPGLRIEPGDASRTVAGLPPPDAVFLGGSVGDEELFSLCWSALKPGGRLVANAVTIDGERALYDRHLRYGGDLVRLETAVLDFIGGQRVMRPRMAVTQWAVTKPAQYLAVAP
jgi:precorrin-6Y C5,15-methyltransferase (decarboxylating)